MRELESQGLITRTRRLGSFVKGGPRQANGHIALILQCGNSIFDGELLRAVYDAMDHQYGLKVAITRGDADREAEAIQRAIQDASGILLVPTCAASNLPVLRSALRSGVPLVCLDLIPDGVKVDAVVSDNRNDVLNAVRMLVSRGQRYEGHMQALSEAGVSNPNELVRAYVKPGDWDYLRQSIFDALVAMRHNMPDPPTAVVCMGERSLAAVLDSCERLGLQVPDDLEILTYCEQPAWKLCSRGYPIHRLQQRLNEMGTEGVNRLMQLMAEPDEPRILRIPADLFPAETPEPHPLMEVAPAALATSTATLQTHGT